MVAGRNEFSISVETLNACQEHKVLRILPEEIMLLEC